MTWIIIALLVACGIADVVTTLKGLRLGATEANPAAAWVFRKLGPEAGTLALKVVCTAVIVFVLIVRPAWWPLGVLFLLGYAAVLVNNFRVIKSL